MKQYSQYNVEHYLNELFEVEKGGTFLEIGAWHGVNFSQTLWLEEQGWAGLCVDPFPVGFEGRRCQLCQMAVAPPSNGKTRKFIRVFTDKRDGGDVSYFSGFLDSIGTHWPLISEHCSYEEVQVTTIAPMALYKLYRLPFYIEFLSLDTEGTELEILRALDLDLYRFGMIMVEHNGGPSKGAIFDLLTGHGYRRFAELVIDDIYIQKGS